MSNVPCLLGIYESGAEYYICELPIFDYDPSVAYDVTIYNDNGKVTLPGLVQYTSAPTLASIDPCIDRGDMAAVWGIGPQCPVGATITLRGARFPAADAVTVQFITGASNPMTVTLLAPTLINSTTLTATLPALDNVTAAATYGRYGNVQASFTSLNVTTTSNKLMNYLYMAPNAPSITSVTSTMCDSFSALQLTNCHAMATITVAGSNLALREELDLIVSLGSSFQGQQKGHHTQTRT